MRVTRLFTLILAAFLLITQPGRAATEVPFKFSSGMIWLEVNLASCSEPLRFLLDSGAGKSVLHLGTARRLGVKLGARETVQGVQGRCAAYRVDRLDAAIASEPLPRSLLALDLSSISAACGTRIDGLLGADFFRNRIVQIDFTAQKVRILSRSELTNCGGQSLPLSRRGDALCLRVGVNGHPAQWMRLDTGYSGALEWVTAGARTPRAAGTSMAVTAASHGQIHTEVLLGAERLSEVKTGVHRQPIFPGEAGLVGNGVLSQFRVTVDAAGSRLLLQRVGR